MTAAREAGMDKVGIEGCVHVYNDGGRDMLHRGSMVVNVVLAICLVASQVSAEVFAYPKKGQSQQQFEQDQFGCHQWAKGQTGVDPTQAQASTAAPPPERGGAVRGAGRGAAVGAIGGAIGGDAGKGAAIGAAAGGTVGAARQAGRNQQAAQAQQQAQAQAQAGRSNYDRAYAACMEGRGYQVR
jgi:Glycine-zipper domain